MNQELNLSEYEIYTYYLSVFNHFDDMLRECYYHFRLNKTDCEALMYKRDHFEQLSTHVKLAFDIEKYDEKMLSGNSIEGLSVQKFTIKGLIHKSVSILENLPFSENIKSKSISITLVQIAKNYYVVPYHNFSHAFQVFINFFHFYKQQSLKKWINPF